MARSNFAIRAVLRNMAPLLAVDVSWPGCLFSSSPRADFSGEVRMFRERSAPAKEVEEVARSATPFRSAGASPREMQHPVALMSPCAWPEARVFGAGRAPAQAEGALA